MNFEDDANASLTPMVDTAYNLGRQAQYELRRAGNCYWSEFPVVNRCIHKGNYGKPCPTDYHECPLKKEEKK